MTTTKDHHFASRVEWRRRPEDEAVAAMDYHRDHTVTIPGKTPIRMSAAPQYKGDTDLPNPEEMFVAALSSCHMLTYLALAARAGITVISYTDDASGVLATAPHPVTGRGGMRMTRVALRPRIEVAAGSDLDRARALMEKAHEHCFISGSVNSEVTTEVELIAV